MKVTLYRRDFTDLAVQPTVDFSVEKYSHSVFGGPKRAIIRAEGKVESLFELSNHLREPVEILNDLGDCVWWGYVTRVIIHTEIGSYGVDLETMANKVAVAYTDDDNFRHTTDWSSDSNSIDEYGTKELLLSKADVTESDALQTRDVYLANAKFPTPVLQFLMGKEATATIYCNGWLDTLKWRYYQNLTGKESYEETGTGGREVGEDDRPKLAQSFQIEADEAWDATSIWLRAWYQGDNAPPTDSIIVSLKSDNAGVPGTTLASCTLTYESFGERAEWIEFALSSAVTLNPSTTYWIHVERTGAVDPDAYYMFDTNVEVGYPRGALYLYYTNLGTWGPDAPNDDYGDLLFIVIGETETTEQISTLVTSVGQFFEGTIIEDDSGLDSSSYRDGDTSGFYELEKLLKGGTTNDRRLLCEVTRNRYLRVYEEDAEPAKTVDSYALDKNGRLLTSALTPVDPSLCLVGIWCHLHDVIPASVDFSLISDPSLFFIDEAEYNVRNGEYSILATRNQEHLLDIGGVEQG
jgi:hypothetical protein